MSPVFGHGRLRLYLLKLVDEAPRHGYEVIRLLQDRFMGVYSPSPGTIYPRLARLEEEGLLTHDEQDGRKIYRITDKGREEINRRLDELDELEREITESVSGIAREVKEDVRETVRSLREELTWAAREVQRETKPPAREQARQARDEARAHARQVREEMWHGHAEGHGQAAGQSAGPQAEQEAGCGGTSARRERPGWQDFTDWTGRPGRQRPPGGSARREFDTLAREFGNELRARIRQAGALGEGALDELRLILDETLERIRADVFGALKPRRDGETEHSPATGDNGPAEAADAPGAPGTSSPPRATGDDSPAGGTSPPAPGTSSPAPPDDSVPPAPGG